MISSDCSWNVYYIPVSTSGVVLKIVASMWFFQARKPYLYVCKQQTRKGHTSDSRERKHEELLVADAVTNSSEHRQQHQHDDTPDELQRQEQEPQQTPLTSLVQQYFERSNGEEQNRKKNQRRTNRSKDGRHSDAASFNPRRFFVDTQNKT